MPEDGRTAHLHPRPSPVAEVGSPDARGAVLPATVHEVSVERWCDGVAAGAQDRVADEVPIALVYNGTPHVVMLATPADIEDLATGFTLSEAVVRSAGEIRSVSSSMRGDGAIEAHITIAPERFSELLRRQRNLSGRTGCGLCGAQNIEDAIRAPARASDGVRISVAELHDALSTLSSKQPVNAQTGSVHAAAWVEPGRGIQIVREDVGRHNALDKVIGAIVHDRRDFATGWFLVTSRASYEMVQKAATVGGTLLAAVSAPTAFAIRLAESGGVTLVGFAREHTHVVYAHPQRITRQ